MLRSIVCTWSRTGAQPAAAGSPAVRTSSARRGRVLLPHRPVDRRASDPRRPRRIDRRRRPRRRLRTAFGLLHDREALVQRVLAGPQLPGHRLVDDRHRRRCVAVELGEVAPAADRDAQRVEIARRDVVELHQRRRAQPVSCASPFGEDRQQHAALQRRRRDATAAASTPGTARALLDRIEVELLSARLVVALRARVQADERRCAPSRIRVHRAARPACCGRTVPRRSARRSRAPISDTTSRLRSGRCASPSAPPRPPAFSDLVQVGARQRESPAPARTATPVSTEMPAVNSSTARIEARDRSTRRPGTADGTTTARCVPTSATSSPATPPSTASSTLSVSSCRTIAAAARAHRRADARSPSRARRLRQQQVGEVDARDQQHQADHRHHHAAGEHELRRGR